MKAALFASCPKTHDALKALGPFLAAGKSHSCDTGLTSNQLQSQVRGTHCIVIGVGSEPDQVTHALHVLKLGSRTHPCVVVVKPLGYRRFAESLSAMPPLESQLIAGRIVGAILIASEKGDCFSSFPRPFVEKKLHTVASLDWDPAGCEQIAAHIVKVVDASVGL